MSYQKWKIRPLISAKNGSGGNKNQRLGCPILVQVCVVILWESTRVNFKVGWRSCSVSYLYSSTILFKDKWRTEILKFFSPSTTLTYFSLSRGSHNLRVYFHHCWLVFISIIYKQNLNLNMSISLSFKFFYFLPSLEFLLISYIYFIWIFLLYREFLFICILSYILYDILNTYSISFAKVLLTLNSANTVDF